MRDPLAKTLDVLAASANPHAVDVLLAALEMPREATVQRAVIALLRRSHVRGQLEIVRRLDSLPPAAREQLLDNVFYLESTLRQCLLHGDPLLKRNALEIVRAAEDYGQAPVLLSMLQDAACDLHDAVARTLDELVDRLWERLHRRDTGAPERATRRHAPQVRQTLLAAFDHVCQEFATLSRPESVVHGVLALGDPEHVAVRRVLVQGPPECRELAARLLVTSSHPGVMQLILDCMGKNYPLPRAFDALQTRDDLEFVAHLLRWFPRRLTAAQQKNFRQVETVAWLQGDLDWLTTLPPALQPRLAEFVAASGLRTDWKLRVQEWLVRHGSPMGRLAAAEVLAALKESDVHAIIFEGLESDDPEIQAWATGQLRSRGIPQALTMLVERLDSPLPAVRDAARSELEGFNVERMLMFFDQLDPHVCRRAGRLVRKTDPDYAGKLTGELASHVRRRRIRAARGAQALGLHAEVAPALLALLDDADPLVRRTGIEVLADLPDDQSLAAVRQCLGDSSPRVREAAVAALRRMHAAPAVCGTAAGESPP